MLEDPWREPRPEMFELTASPREAPDEPEEMLIAFEDGIAVSVNGEKLSPAALLARLNEIGGKHGVGLAGDGVRAARVAGAEQQRPHRCGDTAEGQPGSALASATEQPAPRGPVLERRIRLLLDELLRIHS